MKPNFLFRRTNPILILLAAAVLLAACGGQPAPTASPTSTAVLTTTSAPETPTLPAATSTPLPTTTPVASTATTRPPTSTPAATASAAEVRIQFAAGATSGVVEGSLQPGQTQDFVLTAAAGQPLIVSTSSYNNDVTFSVSGKQDGKILLPASQKVSSWQTLLTVSQDYLIRVIAGATPENFTLSVITPARIQFAAGTDSIVEKGSTPGGLVVSYILRAAQNQRMTISLDVADDSALLSVYGFQDGQPYLRSAVGSKTFDMSLPATQDYIVQVVPNAGQVTDYTLHITVK